VLKEIDGAGKVIPAIGFSSLCLSKIIDLGKRRKNREEKEREEEA
jgi:hypothetical protein